MTYSCLSVCNFSFRAAVNSRLVLTKSALTSLYKNKIVAESYIAIKKKWKTIWPLVNKVGI